MCEHVHNVNPRSAQPKLAVRVEVSFECAVKVVEGTAELSDIHRRPSLSLASFGLQLAEAGSLHAHEPLGHICRVHLTLGGVIS